MHFTNTVSIARSAHDVFGYLAAFENVPRWNYAISRTWQVSAGPVGVGSRYRQERTLPRRSEETFEVVEFVPDDRIVVSGNLGPFGARLSYQLAGTDGTTVLTNAVELEATGLARVVAPLLANRVKSAVAANLRVLKQLLESQSGAGS